MSRTTNIAFGRKVKVVIYTDANNSQFVFESDLMNGKRGLKITGTIKKYFAIQPPEATIDIYNLSPIEAANILSIRTKKVANSEKYVDYPLYVKVLAGYSNGYFGEIFNGQILKPTMVKPDANNTILRLTCIDGANFISAGSALTQTFNDGINFYDVAKQVASGSKVPINVYVSDTLKNYKVDGSFVTSNTTYQTLESIASETGVVFSFKDGSAYLQTLSELMNMKQEAFVLNSKTGLMGFPSLAIDGITVQSVLNPKLDVLGLIKLDNSDISIEQPDFLANREIGAWLSTDGLYRIITLIHQFDTTTGAFTTNCKCLARNYYNILT